MLGQFRFWLLIALAVLDLTGCKFDCVPLLSGRLLELRRVGKENGLPEYLLSFSQSLGRQAQ